MQRAPAEARVFHALLIGAALPVLIVPFVWGAAFWARRRAQVTGARVWAQRLMGLAVVDTLVAAMLIGMFTLLPSPVEVGRPPPPSPIIGVTIEEEVDEGVVVTPREGSPAARGGVLAGDIVAAVDGAPIRSTEDLQTAISQGPLSPRVLLVRRGGTEREVQVTPTRGTSQGTLRPGADGLFVPRQEMTPSECAVAESPAMVAGAAAVWLGVVAVLLVVLARLGRGHRPLVFFGSAIAIFVMASLLGAGTRIGGCALAGGYAPGTLLLGLIGHGAALAVGGWWLMRRVNGEAAILPALPRSQVYAQSIYYTFAWVPRAAIASWGLVSLVSLVAQTGTPIDAFIESDLGAAGAVLLLLGGAVLGPIAEELLFRGALLPWLAKFLSPWRAIVASGLLFGALHVHHGLSIIGPFVLGLILGWARARTGGVLVPILLHMTFNATSLTMLVLLT